MHMYIDAVELVEFRLINRLGPERSLGAVPNYPCVTVARFSPRMLVMVRHFQTSFHSRTRERTLSIALGMTPTATAVAQVR